MTTFYCSCVGFVSTTPGGDRITISDIFLSVHFNSFLNGFVFIFRILVFSVFIIFKTNLFISVHTVVYSLSSYLVYIFSNFMWGDVSGQSSLAILVLAKFL